MALEATKKPVTGNMDMDTRVIQVSDLKFEIVFDLGMSSIKFGNAETVLSSRYSWSSDTKGKLIPSLTAVATMAVWRSPRLYKT